MNSKFEESTVSAVHDNRCRNKETYLYLLRLIIQLISAISCALDTSTSRPDGCFGPMSSLSNGIVEPVASGLNRAVTAAHFSPASAQLLPVEHAKFKTPLFHKGVFHLCSLFDPMNLGTFPDYPLIRCVDLRFRKEDSPHD